MRRGGANPHALSVGSIDTEASGSALLASGALSRIDATWVVDAGRATANHANPMRGPFLSAMVAKRRPVHGSRRVLGEGSGRTRVEDADLVAAQESDIRVRFRGNILPE